MIAEVFCLPFPQAQKLRWEGRGCGLSSKGGTAQTGLLSQLNGPAPFLHSRLVDSYTLCPSLKSSVSLGPSHPQGTLAEETDLEGGRGRKEISLAVRKGTSLLYLPYALPS